MHFRAEHEDHQVPPVRPYQPMTLVDLAGHLARVADDSQRWRLVAEFLEEYRWEAASDRLALLAEEPPATGDGRWDVFVAALAEHVALDDHRRGPRRASSSHHRS